MKKLKVNIAYMLYIYNKINHQVLTHDKDHDLFENGLVESSGTQFLSSGLITSHHSPSSHDTYDPATSNAAAAAEDSSTHTHVVEKQVM